LGCGAFKAVSKRALRGTTDLASYFAIKTRLDGQIGVHTCLMMVYFDAAVLTVLSAIGNVGREQYNGKLRRVPLIVGPTNKRPNKQSQYDHFPGFVKITLSALPDYL
jgi:hypothetical protein